MNSHETAFCPFSGSCFLCWLLLLFLAHASFAGSRFSFRLTLPLLAHASLSGSRFLRWLTLLFPAHASFAGSCFPAVFSYRLCQVCFPLLISVLPQKYARNSSYGLFYIKSVKSTLFHACVVVGARILLPTTRSLISGPAVGAEAYSWFSPNRISAPAFMLLSSRAPHSRIVPSRLPGRRRPPPCRRRPLR